jgi:O-antigen ligase
MNTLVTDNARTQGGAGQWLLLSAYLLAVVIPPLWVISWTPSPTLLNQLWALGGWGLVLVIHRCVPPMGARRYPVFALNLSLSIVCFAILGSWILGSLPPSLAMPPLGCVIVATACASLGARAAACASPDPDGLQAFEPFAWGLVMAGVLSAVVSVIQYFAPDLSDGTWIAVSGLPGRAVGNLRQPNHLASLLIWGVIALVPLAEWKRLPVWLAGVLGALLIFGVILSGSRTGLYAGVALLLAWGAAEQVMEMQGRTDGRLSRPVRWMLMLTPLVAALLWWGLDLQAEHAHHVFGAKERLAERDLTSSHAGIWKNTLAMIAQQPWRGVGWGQFNFAWTLTPFPDRPTAFFDHTHDLPLQLAVELGVPLAAVVFGLMMLALWFGMRRAWATRGPAGHGARAAWMMVVMIGIHSLDEYPLWYTYFLLPAAWAWGFALGSGPAPRSSRPVLHGTEGSVRPREIDETNVIRLSGDGIVLRCIGAVMIAVALAATWDYYRVSTIFMDLETPPLIDRITTGERSVLFAHHADYAEATTSEPPSRALGALERATHSLLDARLMIAWANALAESGQFDRARYVAARLREFHKAEADEFFAPCNAIGGAAAVGKAPASAPMAGASGASDAASAARAAASKPSTASGAGALDANADVKQSVAQATALPFQCEAPSVPLTWRDFQ